MFFITQQTPQEDVIRAVVKFIVNRCDVNNLLTIGAQVFGSVSDPRVAKFKESVQYFLNGTKDGFLRYKPFPSGLFTFLYVILKIIWVAM